MSRRIVIHNHLPRIGDVSYSGVSEAELRKKLDDAQMSYGPSSREAREIKKELGRRSLEGNGGLIREDAGDAYFSLTQQDPYQYRDGVAAAKTKQPFNPPYPENTEFRKMWVAGYRSVLPV